MLRERGLREVLLTHPDGYSVLVLEIGCWDEFFDVLERAFDRLDAREFMAASALNGLWRRRNKEREARDAGLVLMGMINVGKDLKEHLKAALRAERVHSVLAQRAKEVVDKGGDREALKVPQWVCGTPLSRVIAVVAAACYVHWAKKEGVDSVAVVLKDRVDQDFAKRIYSSVRSLLELVDGRRFKWCRVLTVTDDPASLTSIVRADKGRVPTWDKASQLVAVAYDKRWFSAEDKVEAYERDVRPAELADRISKALIFISKKITTKLARRMDVPVPTAWIKLCRHSLWRTVKAVGELAEVTPVTAASWMSRLIDDEKWRKDYRYFDHSVAYRIGLKAIEKAADGERVDSAIKDAIKEELGEDKLKKRVRSRLGLNTIYASVLRKASEWTSFFPWKDKWWREDQGADFEDLKSRLRVIRELAEVLSKALQKLEERIERRKEKALPVKTDEAVLATVFAAAAVYEWEETDIKEVAESLLQKVARAVSYTEEEAKKKVEKFKRTIKKLADKDTKVVSAAAGVIEVSDDQLERRIEEAARETPLPGAKKTLARAVKSFLRRFLGLADPDEALVDELIAIPQLIMLAEATGPPPNW